MGQSEILIISISLLFIVLITYFLLIFNNRDRMKNNLRNIIDNVPGGVCMFRIDNVFTVMSYNKSFLDIIGYTDDLFKEEVSHQLSKLIFVVDYEKLSINIIEQLNFSSCINSEFRMVKRDGSFIWVAIHGELLKSEDGFDYLNSIFLDITHTKSNNDEAEIGLIEDNIYDSIASGIINLSIDYNPRILDLNKVAIIMFGYTKHDIQNKFENKILKIVHKDDRSILYSSIQKVNALGEDSTENFQCRIIKRDGSIIWLNAVVKLNIDYNGKKDAMMSFIDITEYKKFEKSLKDKTDLLEYFVSNLSIGTIIFEKSNGYQIYYINDIGAKHFGYQEIKNPSYLFLKSIIYSRDLELFDKAIEEVYKNIFDKYLIFRYINKFGNVKWASSTIKKYHEIDGKEHMSITFVDITEFKDYEKLIDLNNDKYKTVIENSGICLIEWDIHLDSLKLYEKAMTVFGFKEVEINAFDKLLKSPLIHKDDIKPLSDCIEQIKTGYMKTQCIVRIKKHNEYFSYKFLFTAFTNNKNMLQNVIILGIPIDNFNESYKIKEIDNNDMFVGDSENYLMFCEVNFTTGSFINGKDSLSEFLNINSSFNYVEYIEHMTDYKIIHEDYVDDFKNIFSRENIIMCFRNKKYFINYGCKILDYKVNKYIDVNYITCIHHSDGHHLVLKIYVTK